MEPFHCTAMPYYRAGVCDTNRVLRHTKVQYIVHWAANHDAVKLHMNIQLTVKAEGLQAWDWPILKNFLRPLPGIFQQGCLQDR